MNCVLCRAPIPEGLSECLECGTSISYSISNGEEFVANDQKITQPPQVAEAAPQIYASWETLQASTPYTKPFQATRSSHTSFIMRKSFIAFIVIMSIMIVVAGGSLFIYLVGSHSLLSILSQPNGVRSTQNLTEIAPTSVLASPSATLPNPYSPHSGRLLINDSLQDNNGGLNWMDDTVSPSVDNQGCRFVDKTYQMINGSASQPYMGYCLALDTDFSNFAYQIQATLLKGSEVGIVFRQMVHYRYYYFSIGANGSYALSWNNGDTNHLLTSGISSAIHIGLNQPNVLAVVANGARLDLYANKQYLASVTDNTYAEGRIGVAIQSDDGSASQASFTNLMLWA